MITMFSMLQSSRSVRIKNQHHAVICGLALLLFLRQIQESTTLIVPNELPSILSLVYANVPPIKKGTDSRFGFGFRLGEHADFQIVYELGPQKETRPMDKDDSDGSSFNKRQVHKTQQLRVQHDTTSASSTWLENLSNAPDSTKNKVKNAKKEILYKTVGTPIILNVPDQTLRQLHMLYKMAFTSTTSSPHSSISTTETTPTTANKVDATLFQERLKILSAPANMEDLHALYEQTGKTMTEVTKELI